jgi:hypothetical protein
VPRAILPSAADSRSSVMLVPVVRRTGRIASSARRAEAVSAASAMTPEN